MDSQKSSDAGAVDILERSVDIFSPFSAGLKEVTELYERHKS